MSDFSFDPSGSKKSPSPFERLKVRTAGVGENQAPKLAQVRIFKEVDGRKGPEEARLSGLDEAVANVASTTKSLTALANGDIAAANVDASQISVKKVDEAVELARKIARDLTANPGLFEEAQVSRLDVPVAEALTKAEDGTVA